MPEIPTLSRLTKEDHELRVTLSYTEHSNNNGITIIQNTLNKEASIKKNYELFHSLHVLFSLIRVCTEVLLHLSFILGL